MGMHIGQGRSGKFSWTQRGWRLVLPTLLLFGIGTAPVAATAADLYVQSVKAVLYAQPALGAKKIATVSRGEVLQQVERKGGWYKVRAHDQEGWISRLLVSSRPPAATVSLLQQNTSDLGSGARRRASSFTTAAAARGLSEDRARRSDSYRTDYAGVETMESLTISNDEAMTFLQQGVGHDQ